MIITDEFISEVMYDCELNRMQFKLLGFNYPPEDGWEIKITERSIDQRTFDLLVLLKGKLALKAQQQIILNYDLLNKLQDNNQTIIVSNKNAIKLKIYCDGACKNNPGEAGSGIAIYMDNEKPILLYGDYISDGTNNIAELNALHKALLTASEYKTSTIEIYSDSKYSIDCITNWAYTWKAKGWTKSGGEIKNLDLIKEIHNLYDSMKGKVIINHVKGHNGIEGNELADRMAVLAIKFKNRDYKQYDYKDTNVVLNLPSY